MPTLTIYSRADCHLCEQARTILAALRPALSYDLRIVDINTDPELTARYGVTIPVVALNGEDLLRWPFTGAAAYAVLRRRLQEDR